MIIVIDYDSGNTANVLRALEKIGVPAELSADKEKILAADGLILPGRVGAKRFGSCNQRGRNKGSSTFRNLLRYADFNRKRTGA